MYIEREHASAENLNKAKDALLRAIKTLRELNIDHLLMEILHGIKQHQKFNQMNSQSIIQFQILVWKKISLIHKKVLLCLKAN